MSVDTFVVLQTDINLSSLQTTFVGDDFGKPAEIALIFGDVLERNPRFDHRIFKNEESNTPNRPV
jgi:hypothetical protein